VAPSPVVELNRAVAVAEADGLEAGLGAMDTLEGLDSYLYFHAARADLLRRAGRRAAAAAAYARAIALCANAVERRYLQRRLAEVS
jgi:RNA polymerase sigma-70 factor, ECF subfamily